MNSHSFPTQTRRRDVKKLILVTLTVAAITGFAYFQHSLGNPCSRTTCDGPKKVAVGTCPYTGCETPVEVKACTPEDCPKTVATCSYTTCEEPEIVTTTCNGSDATCSKPVVVAGVDEAPCGDPLCCGGGKHVGFFPTEEGEGPSNPRIPT